MFSTLTKLHLKTLSVFVFVSFSNPVLHQVQKAHLRQYQKIHKNTVNCIVFCKASANQVDTEHLQINKFHAESRKVGLGGGDHIYFYIFTYIYIRIHIYIYIQMPGTISMGQVAPRKAQVLPRWCPGSSSGRSWRKTWCGSRATRWAQKAALAMLIKALGPSF